MYILLMVKLAVENYGRQILNIRNPKKPKAAKKPNSKQKIVKIAIDRAGDPNLPSNNKKLEELFINKEKDYIFDGKPYNKQVFLDHLDDFVKLYPYFEARYKKYVQNDIFSKIVNETSKTVANQEALKPHEVATSADREKYLKLKNEIDGINAAFETKTLSKSEIKKKKTEANKLINEYDKLLENATSNAKFTNSTYYNDITNGIKKLMDNALPKTEGDIIKKIVLLNNECDDIIHKFDYTVYQIPDDYNKIEEMKLKINEIKRLANILSKETQEKYKDTINLKFYENTYDFFTNLKKYYDKCTGTQIWKTLMAGKPYSSGKYKYSSIEDYLKETIGKKIAYGDTTFNEDGNFMMYLNTPQKKLYSDAKEAIDESRKAETEILTPVKKPNDKHSEYILLMEKASKIIEKMEKDGRSSDDITNAMGSQNAMQEAYQEYQRDPSMYPNIFDKLNDELDNIKRFAGQDPEPVIPSSPVKGPTTKVQETKTRRRMLKSKLVNLFENIEKSDSKFDDIRKIDPSYSVDEIQKIDRKSVV